MKTAGAENPNRCVAMKPIPVDQIRVQAGCTTLLLLSAPTEFFIINR
jgi:hypothetical protein